MARFNAIISNQRDDLEIFNPYLIILRYCQVYLRNFIY